MQTLTVTLLKEDAVIPVKDIDNILRVGKYKYLFSVNLGEQFTKPIIKLLDDYCNSCTPLPEKIEMTYDNL